jgi:hypothetical protein
MIDSSFELTIYDLRLLEQLRLKRLRSSFAQSLSCCLIYLNHQKTLMVYCLELKDLQNLLNDLEDLCGYAELVLGAKVIALYFIEEEIYCAQIDSILKHSQ